MIEGNYFVQRVSFCSVRHSFQVNVSDNKKNIHIVKKIWKSMSTNNCLLKTATK